MKLSKPLLCFMVPLIILMALILTNFFTGYDFSSFFRGAQPREEVNFQNYKDIVTVVTAVLTLVIALATIMASFSFSKIKEKEEKVADISNDIEEKKNQLDQFLLIEKARTILSLEENSPEAHERAIDLYTEAINCYEKNISLHLLRGDAYLLTKKKQYIHKAVQDFECAINLDQHSDHAYLGLGKAKFQFALRDIDKNPDCTTQHDYTDAKKLSLKKDANVGMNVTTKQEIENSITLFKKASQLQPQSFEAYYEWAKALTTLKRPKEAVLRYNDAYRYSDKHPTYGFIYSYYWIQTYENNLIDKTKQRDLKKVVEILHNVASNNDQNSKAAYALLWFLYSKVTKLSSPNLRIRIIEECRRCSDLFTINKLFQP